MQPDQLFLDFQSALAGRYSLERELGRGGMGVVYLAREVRLDRLVAIKLLPPTRASDAKLRERFLREARTAAKLSHPHIIPIFTVDEVGEFVFFAMAYVAGETLTERVVRRGPLAPSEAARVLREIAWALAYAHSQGLVHRDVKPDNIMLEDASGRGLVADFGIAGQVRGAAGLDGGEVIGTPEFMSPEQALGEHVDARSDLYALGVVGFFALSGKLPFEAGKAAEVLAKQVTEPAPPLASVAPGVPRRIAQAIDRCLAKDPADRPASGENVAELLGVALEQRRELPVALRVFVKRNARLGGVGGLIYVFSIPFMMATVASLFGRRGSGDAALWTFVLAVTVVPFGILVGRARRFLASGFGPEELAVAFRAELEQGREERVFEYGRGPSLYERVLRLLGAGGLAIAGVSGFILFGGPVWAAPGLAQLFGWSLSTGLIAGFLALVRLQRRIDLDTRIWSWLWQGPLGRLMFRVARVLSPARSLPPPATHRPTELALAMAAEQLFDELPREARRQLRDLPDVVRRLERDAQKMRLRLEELNEALEGTRDEGRGKGGDVAIPARHDRIVSDLEAERELVQARLGDAVRALETIRLNLLRLHAGSGSVRNLTTDLGLARSVAQEIGFLLEGRREVERELR
ncbi:MAG TPA: serine/threonine-protein kinase [Gemmatimonadales bacterium]|nr:serine/threonine-protein kinase [Gemmatimonadales bacterium]